MQFAPADIRSDEVCCSDVWGGGKFERESKKQGSYAINQGVQSSWVGSSKFRTGSASLYMCCETRHHHSVHIHWPIQNQMGFGDDQREHAKAIFWQYTKTFLHPLISTGSSV